MLDTAYLDTIAAYFASGDLAFDFEHGDEARRQQILEYLERLMDLADEADALATKLIFKGGYLEALSGAGAASDVDSGPNSGADSGAASDTATKSGSGESDQK